MRVLYSFFILVLFGVLKWAFDSFVWDATVHILQSKFGVSEANVITGISSFIFPGLIAFGTIAGAYNLGRRYPVSGPPNAPSSPAGTAIAVSSSSPQQSWPFLIQAAIILAIVSGGVGYYLNQYFHLGEIDPTAVKS